MKTIFIHGLGNGGASWDETLAHMKNGTDILCPNLSAMLAKKKVSYENLYASFIKYCDKIEGQIHLCGISLGGVIALNYALDFPQRVKSLVLIGSPYKIPRIAFALQSVIFKFLPEKIFRDMAFDKKDTLALCKSMKNLDFTQDLKRIDCPSLILCGEKDRANIQAAYYLANTIAGAKLRIIENAGHIVNEEKAKTLAEILQEFYEIFPVS